MKDLNFSPNPLEFLCNLKAYNTFSFQDLHNAEAKYAKKLKGVIFYLAIEELIVTDDVSICYLFLQHQQIID